MKNNNHDENVKMLLHGDVMDKTLEAMIQPEPLLKIGGIDDRDNVFAIVGAGAGNIGRAIRACAITCLGSLPRKLQRLTK